MLKHFLTLTSLTLCTALTAQTTYYSDAVNGDDSANTGLLPSSAYRSISKPASLMVSGDTLVVMPGTYNLATESSFPIRFGSGQAQDNITIIGIEGPANTIIDGGGSYAGIGMVRFQENAPGARITGFSFKNMDDAFWSCAIRLGSASGDAFRAVDVEIDNCIFDSTISRPLVLFGSNAGTRQSTGMRIHNNLIIENDPNRQTVALYGDGDNHFYNNVIMSVNAINARASVFLDSIVPTAPCAAVVQNNIIIGGLGSAGIEAGPAGSAVTVKNNNVFGHATNFVNLIPDPSNVSVDPMFVSATDYHLQAGSPMIDAGTSNLPLIRHDLDGFPGLYGAAPDIGAYETHPTDFALTAPPVLGGSVSFSFTGNAGVAAVFLGFNEISFVAPFGVVLTDTLFLLRSTASPSTLTLPVPNVPSAEGVRVVFQGLFAGSNLEMLNVAHTYIRK